MGSHSHGTRVARNGLAGPHARSASPGPATGIRRVRFDLAARPFLVLVELTRACDLACRHCRAEARARPEPDDLTTEEVRALLDDLASLGPPRPVVVLTGGDPLRRADLTELVAHGARGGLAMAVAAAGTERVGRTSLAELRRAGAGALSLSIDGADRGAHDAFRGVAGSFDWTLAAARAAKEVGLRLQVNTTVCSETVSELPAIYRLITELEANLWSAFFLVPTGRGRLLGALSAADTEEVLGFLAGVGGAVPVKTTEAPAFRRVVLSRQPGAPGRRRRAPLAVGEGNGVVFVSHRGDVQPSGFLPLVAGNVREQRLTEIYSSAPLFRALRDPGRLAGRCGRCEYREVCGGSRAHAFAASGDPLGEDPTCPWEPARLVGE